MDKLKGSVLAKLTAWALFLTSAVGTVYFGVLTIIYFSEDYYAITYDEAREDAFLRSNAQYSIEAFCYRGDDSIAERMADRCFRYGIIETTGLSVEDLENLDFNSKESYLDTNFFMDDLTIAPDQLLVYRMIQRGAYGMLDGGMQGTYKEYLNSLKKSGMSAEPSDIKLSIGGAEPEAGWEWYSQYADRVCYDVSGGIFYYRSEDKYYPVQDVIFLNYNGTQYHFSYNFTNKNYVLTGLGTADKYVPDFSEDNAYIAAEEADKEELDAVEQFLQGQGFDTSLTFNELDDTAFNYAYWGKLLLDGIREIDSSELTLIHTEDLEAEQFVDEAGYYLDENYTLMVAEKVEARSFWIVSLIPKEVPANVGDLYLEQWVIDEVYSYGRNMVGILICLALLVLSTTIFLIIAAGHRKNREEIVLEPFPDKIPFDVWSVIVFFVELGLAVLMVALIGAELSRAKNVYMDFAFTVRLSYVGIMLIAGIALWYVLGFAVRVKHGKWWKNNVCYWICSRICGYIRKAFLLVCQNINILWKLLIMMGVLVIVDLFAVATMVNELPDELLVLFWIFEKSLLCVFLMKFAQQARVLQEGSKRLADGELQYQIDTSKMFWECKKHGENLNKIGIGMTKAVDERMKSERLKTELITNVSHDIKTPLTSIINYVDLLGKEELHNEKAAEYLEVLERQSSKLKKLIEDLVEASKAASGSVAVTNEELEAGVFLTQTVGEFEEKLGAADLELIIKKPEEPLYIMADGRHLWRVVDNLMNNACKYAQPYSRVYVNLESAANQVSITFRNMSRFPLNVNGEELTERFVRGDKSRNTEGHGLGLSIAKSLMNLMNGEMEIFVDGDLFKVVLTFQRVQKKPTVNIYL